MLTIAFPAEEGAAGFRPERAGAHCGPAFQVEKMVLVCDLGYIGTVSAAVEDGFFLLCHTSEWEVVGIILSGLFGREQGRLSGLWLRH